MNEKRLRLSVIVPAYNEADNIGPCVNSLVKQDLPEAEYEIIVVDNDSSDDTLAIAESLGVICTVQHKRGRAAAKNAGVKLAKADLMLFVDADCIADAKLLGLIVREFEKSDVGCVAGEVRPRVQDTLTPMEKFLIERGHLEQGQHIKHPFLPFAVTANAAYRREVFDKIGFFDESMFGEDADFSWRMQLESDYKLTYLPEAAVYHPYDTSEKGLFKQKRRHAFGSVMLYKKYRKYRQEEKKSLKNAFWEYRSIASRWLRFYFWHFEKLRKPSLPSPVNKYQLVFETGWKAGLIHGSVRHRIWCL